MRKVISHPQAIGQCRSWLEENLPDIPLVDASSTASAAQQAAEDASVAAIASEAAASLYGLRVVKHKIEDNPNNFTRFLVIGSEMQGPSGNDKTSIMFSVKDQAGILYHMLEPFSKRDHQPGQDREPADEGQGLGVYLLPRYGGACSGSEHCRCGRRTARLLPVSQGARFLSEGPLKGLGLSAWAVTENCKFRNVGRQMMKLFTLINWRLSVSA